MPQASTNQAIHRAIADLRRGAAVLVCNESGGMLVMAAEQVSAKRLADMREIAEAMPGLLLTIPRATAIGLAPRTGMGAASVMLTAQSTPDHILALIGDAPLENADSLTALGERPGSLAASALILMRIARLLPAALAAHINAITDIAAARKWAGARGVLVAETSAIDGFEAVMAKGLREAARARLPLADAEHTEIAIFRPDDGGAEHFALIVHPAHGSAIAAPPLVRIHSQCITGDILGSLKCDCGDQLRDAIAAMAKGGGGILIYLAQEGRDIGLVNKLRAYALQDGGLDTVEANHALGFETDHRFFLPAAEMLRRLGHTEIKLMTNNPDKIKMIEEAGITIAERVPLITATNPHNAKYMETKKNRLGHL